MARNAFDHSCTLIPLASKGSLKYVAVIARAEQIPYTFFRAATGAGDTDGAAATGSDGDAETAGRGAACGADAGAGRFAAGVYAKSTSITVKLLFCKFSMAP